MNNFGLKKYSVAVLMSTYNGEKYLREQVNSILRQQDVDIHLFIRDDVSTDSTVQILKEYSRNSSNISVSYGKKNLGPGMSFMRLLYKIGDKDFDYYAFADQDDIWLEEKLIRGIRKLEGVSDQSETERLLYGSNQILYKDGVECGLRYKERISLDVVSVINKNYISGCTFVMNRNLVKTLISAPLPEKYIIDHTTHDSWVILCALAIGKVIYDPESYILYRIHENNTVGIKTATLLDQVKNALRINDGLTKKWAIRSVKAKAVLERYGVINEADKELFEEYAYYKKNLKRRTCLIKDAKTMKGSIEKTWIFRLKVLAGYV